MSCGRLDRDRAAGANQRSDASANTGPWVCTPGSVPRLRASSISIGVPSLILIFTLAGCGSVGEPLPPLLNIPGRVSDLRVDQTADRGELRWTWPLLTSEGSTLRDLEKFEVKALDIPADAGPPPVDAFEQLGTVVSVVEGEALPEAGAGGEVSVEISLAERLEKRTAFAVRGVSSRGKTGPWSDFVIRQILRPASALEKPETEATAGGVRLRWAAVERAARYVVERRGEQGYEIAGTTDRNGFVDAAAPWDEPLVYRVRSQVGEGAGAVESDPSPEVEITLTDTFPPAAPRLLRAVSAGETVELTWAASPEDDVAGYVVERNGEPLHEGLVETPAFSDGAPLREAPSEYRVRAVDEKGNRSEASEPAVAAP